jgi:hypothetical protein
MNNETTGTDLVLASTLASELEYAIRELKERLDLLNSDPRQVRSGRLMEGIGNICYQLSTISDETLQDMGEDAVWNEFPPLAT